MGEAHPSGLKVIRPVVFRPQDGPQNTFLTTPAEIAIYGGAAGGGKTFGLLLEALRCRTIKNFKCLIFRRNATQIENLGGLWDTSELIYPYVGGRGSRHRHTWTWDNGFEVAFRHLDREDDKHAYQGAQVPFIGFDELTHFTATQFWYMLSRNRSMTGRPGYIRATTNPGGKDHWVTKLIEWYIDENGYPITERAGKVRWFFRSRDKLVWGDSSAELLQKYGSEAAGAMKSFTFIPAKVEDNRILLAKDKGYLANLRAMPMIDRLALLEGCHHVRPAQGLFFRREWFPVIPLLPPTRMRTIRYWDLGATAKTEFNDPDFTAGVKMTVDPDGVYYIPNVVKFREGPAQVEKRMLTVASQDGRTCEIHINLDPGQAGVAQQYHLLRLLDGYSVTFHRETGDQLVRCKPLSSRVENGFVKLIQGPWVDDYLADMEEFPDGAHDDTVMASAMAHSVLVSASEPAEFPESGYDDCWRSSGRESRALDG